MKLIIAVVFNIVGTVLSQKPELHLCEEPEMDRPCMFMCELKDSTTAAVMIYKDNVEIASCNDAATCMVKSTQHSDAMITWHSHGNMTMIHFTLKELNITTDQGKWRCTHGTETSDEETLTVYSIPSSCNLMTEGEGVNATVKCHVNCAYPVSEVEVKLYVDNKEATEMATKKPADSSSCDAKEEESVTYAWPVMYKPESVYKCECIVTALDWAEADVLEGKGGEEGGVQTTTIVAIVIVVVFVILAVVIAVILIKKRRNAKGGAQLATEAEGEREEL